MRKNSYYRKVPHVNVFIHVFGTRKDGDPSDQAVFNCSEGLHFQWQPV